MTEIHNEETDTKGRYWMTVDGHEAVMTYTRQGEDVMVINHTGVPKELGGQGIATRLLEHVIEDVRAKDRKIVPVCSFVKAKVEKTPEWQDVLAA